MEPTQEARSIAVSTPLGGDTLILRRMSANEQLSRLFEFDLDMVSLDAQIKMDDVVGKPMTVRLDVPQEDTKRFFNGVVSRFTQVGMLGRYHRYRATLRPWLWFLTRTADCRIFQEMTAPDIIKQVFRDQGFTDFTDSLSGSYRTWEYCVQYRETDFNFVSRLMEQEGIYYFFSHEDGKHKLVLCDSYGSHEKIKHYDEVPYFPPGGTPREQEHFYDWVLRKELQPGVYALNDFDFERPKASLQVKSTVSRDHEAADFEVYDYPGEYVQNADGEQYSKVRIEELQAQHETVVGTGNARGLHAGGLFKLADYPREDQNREYLIVSATHELESDAFGAGAGGGGSAGAVYAGTIVAMDAKEPYRPPRSTPKPVVQGPQTAIVVGKSGEEIWTDKYGRVKVQFHWDREGKSDENSSCWVRVAQVWAGKGWGGIHVPRMGQEVIVDFLEGDPDRPIITGRVYNADCMPPYALPGDQNHSGIKSHSTKGGSADNFNEIRMEDTKGSELFYVQAEKDHQKLVKNDRKREIGRDERLEVGRDQSESIGRNKSIKVTDNHTESIGKDCSIDVTKNQTVGVGEKQGISVGKDRSLDVGGNLTENVEKDMSVTVVKSVNRDVGETYTVKVGKDHKEEVAKGYGLEAKTIYIEAKDQLEIKVGKAQILMKKNGDVQIKGGKINIKGSSDVVIKGSKIGEN